jgi:hypothetical protein
MTDSASNGAVETAKADWASAYRTCQWQPLAPDPSMAALARDSGFEAGAPCGALPELAGERCNPSLSASGHLFGLSHSSAMPALARSWPTSRAATRFD